MDRLEAAEAPERPSILQAMALTEQPEALRVLDLAAAAGWTPLWSAGRRSAFHTRLTRARGPVLALAFGAAEVLASGGTDQAVRLWGPRRETALADPVSALAFGTVRGRPVLAGAGDDGRVLLWDPADGSSLRVLHGQPGRVAGLAFAVAPGGHEVLAVASENDRTGTIDAWDPDTGESRFRKLFFRDMVHATGGLATVPTPEGDLLATFEEDADAVLLLDPVTGTEIRRLEWEYDGGRGHRDLEAASFVPPLVVNRRDGRVLLGVTAQAEMDHQEPDTAAMAVWWDVLTGDLAAQRDLDTNEAILAADGHTRYVTATPPYLLRIGEVGDRPARWLAGHADRVHAASFGTVGGASVLATAGADGAVLLWDPDSAAEPHWRELRPGSGLAVAADPDRPVLVAGGSSSSVTLLDARTGDTLGHLRCHVASGEPGHHCPSLTSEAGWYTVRDHCRSTVAAGVVDGRWLVATCGDADGVVLWDPVSQDVVRVIERAHPRGTVRFGAAGGRGILVSGWGRPDVWDPATGAHLATLQDERFRMYGPVSLAIGSARGRTVVAVAGTAAHGYVFTVDVWDPLTGEHLRRLPIRGPASRRLPPGTRGDALVAAAADLLAVADDGDVHLWDPATGDRLATMSGSDGPVTCLDLTMVHGRTALVAGFAGGTVRLWTVGSPAATTLATFARPVHAVTVAHLDGRPHVFGQAGTGRLTAARLI